MKLEDFNVYNLAMDLGEVVYSEVIKWNYFDKDTVGKQLVRAVDSIAANLSEGMGWVGFITKREKTSVIIPEAHFMKLKPG